MSQILGDLIMSRFSDIFAKILESTGSGKGCIGVLSLVPSTVFVICSLSLLEVLKNGDIRTRLINWA